MNIYEIDNYIKDLQYVGELDLPWDSLRDRKILISGATGLIGSFLIDVLLYKNSFGLNTEIYAISRNEEKARIRFAKNYYNPQLHFWAADIVHPVNQFIDVKFDYILHLASNTHPLLYSTDPIGTISTNIFGTYNMLEYSVKNSSCRFLLASSNEIYGENRGDVEFFDEDYCGYINCNSLRAGYNESKRCSEALCQAYMKQKKIDVVIARLTRTYGPTMLMSDTKAVSQFIKKAIEGQDLILKSSGEQFYSYQYVADSVAGLLTILLKGVNGEAYNVAHASGDIKLKNLAKLIAGKCSKRVLFEIPDEVESSGYSTATKSRLSGKKLMNLGWRPNYDINSGIDQTISILKELHIEVDLNSEKNR